METQQKKRVLSLIQPTGTFTLGNYLGALKNFVGLQDEYECVYGLADLHAITVRQEPAALRKNVWMATPCCWPSASTWRRASFSSRARCPRTPSWPGCWPATPNLASCPG